jgi:hypothetical protein
LFRNSWTGKPGIQAKGHHGHWSIWHLV